MSHGIEVLHQFPDFNALLPDDFSFLDIIRRILGLPEDTVDDALELVGLEEFGNRLAKKYSLGMKQRLGLAGALLGRRLQ